MKLVSFLLLRMYRTQKFENDSCDSCVHVQVFYVLLTIVVLDYLHDSWFYWTHRMLHSRFLYKYVHHLHHK